MPKIISANLNGIRSAATKGFFTWMAEQDADFVCVQELKAQAPDMTAGIPQPAGLPRPFPLCREKGYSGTGVYSKWHRIAW
jgi:exodeoxyribonuclease-3